MIMKSDFYDFYYISTVLAATLIGGLAITGLVACIRHSNNDSKPVSGSIIVQHDSQGKPFSCWSMPLEQINYVDDGIWWDVSNGNRMYIHGSFTQIMVLDGKWDEAWAELGLTGAQCKAIKEQKLKSLELPEKEK